MIKKIQDAIPSKALKDFVLKRFASYRKMKKNLWYKYIISVHKLINIANIEKVKSEVLRVSVLEGILPGVFKDFNPDFGWVEIIDPSSSEKVWVILTSRTGKKYQGTKLFHNEGGVKETISFPEDNIVDYISEWKRWEAKAMIYSLILR
jgi:hypothetical protein